VSSASAGGKYVGVCSLLSIDTRGVALRLFISLICLSLLAGTAPVAAGCDRSSYSEVFDKASVELTKMNNERAKQIKRLLRDLKKLASWTDQEYLRNAAPLVENEQISEFNSRSKALLASVADFGGSGTTIDRGECGKVDELRALFSLLIDNTREKWAFMEKSIEVAIDQTKSARN